MSEETTIKPCPICSKVPRRSDASLYCPSCGFLALEAWWNRLSDAMALERAVEKIEAMMRAPGETDERQLLCDAVGERIFADIGIVPDGVVLSKVQQRARAATLAAALIALAGEVAE